MVLECEFPKTTKSAAFAFAVVPMVKNKANMQYSFGILGLYRFCFAQLWWFSYYTLVLKF